MSSVSGLTSNGAAIEAKERGTGEAIVSLPAVCMEAGAADGAGAWGDSEEILVLLASSAFKDILSAAVEMLVPGDVTPAICSVDDSASAWDVSPSAAEAEILEVSPRLGSIGTFGFAADEGVFDEAPAVFCSMNAAPGLTRPSAEVLKSETVLEDVITTAAWLVDITEPDPLDDADDAVEVPTGARPT